MQQAIVTLIGYGTIAGMIFSCALVGIPLLIQTLRERKRTLQQTKANIDFCKNTTSKVN